MSNRNTLKLMKKAEDAIKKKNFEYAIELYRQALDIDPNNSQARKELRRSQLRRLKMLGLKGSSLKASGALIKMKMYSMRKKWDECIRECENVLFHDPKHNGALQALGRSCANAGYLNSAILAFESVLEQNRKNIVALKELAYLYTDNGEFEKATKYFEQVKKLKPDDGDVQKALRDIAAQGAESQMQDGLAKGEGSFRGLLKDSGDEEEAVKPKKKKKRPKKQ